jgi:phospholipase/carboxylesterase
MKISCVIALHGLGADSGDLMPLQEMMGMNAVLWLFPDAPILPVSVNGGMAMPAWFDILGFLPTDPIDAQGIAQSAQRINEIINEQVSLGINPAEIVLLGFSQGGVVALHAALSASVQVGAVIGLSTWLPVYEQLLPLLKHREDLPIWLGHGSLDSVVPLAAAERAYSRLLAMGMQRVSLHRYPMAHAIIAQELDAVVAWLSDLSDAPSIAGNNA